MKRSLVILGIDSAGGLLAGIIVSLTAGWLATVYRIDLELVQLMGLANLLYGSYSGVLCWLLRQRGSLPQAAVIVLILANSVWAGVCFSSVWWTAASPFGDFHLLFEGAYVLVLAFLEARFVLKPPGQSSL